MYASILLLGGLATLTSLAHAFESSSQPEVRPSFPLYAPSSEVSAQRKECAAWAARGECSKNPAFMETECATSCKQRRESKRKNWHGNDSECINWAHNGECDANPSFMFESCAAACDGVGAKRQAYNERCPRAPDAKAALQPGALTDLFTRAVNEFQQFSPKLVSTSPYIAMFDDFLSPEEIEALIAAGRDKYTRSYAVGVREDGTVGGVKSPVRTSSNTWCQDACANDPIIQKITARVSNLTGVPPTNSEFAQLLEYKACPYKGHPDCQFYGRHSDYIPADKNLNQGVRILTFYIYLTDVEKGGETKFYTDPEIVVQPKAGRAALWASVREDEPHAMESRTDHEALPVFEGVKLGANFWFHQYDFRGPWAKGCTME